MRCIYCLKDKTKNSFKKTEHVLPQAFGKFKNNLTIKKIVCDECNKYFGDNLELHLSRDTIEGIKRFNYNIKKQHEFKSTGKQSRLSIKVNEGPFKGAYAYRDYSELEERIIIKPIPQVGFKKINCMNYEYFPLEKIPDKDYLYNNFEMKKEKSIKILGDNLADAQKHLIKKGISLHLEAEENYLPEEPIDWECNVEEQIDQIILRAIAKIAFNYLAYWNGMEFVIQNYFHPIRKYIRLGEKSSYPFVVIQQKAILGDEPEKGKRRLGHILTLDKSKNGLSIISKISLLNWMTYSILLAKDYQSKNLIIRKGQFFNINNGEIIELIPSDIYYQQQEIQK